MLASACAVFHLHIIRRTPLAELVEIDDTALAPIDVLERRFEFIFVDGVTHSGNKALEVT